MAKTIALLLTVSALAATAHADDATFKAYGFFDVNYENDHFKSDNFLGSQGYILENPALYVNHLNTYLDWKPNDKVRFLAEISFNRDPFQSVQAGNRLSVDSSALYNNIYAQFLGLMTGAGLPAQMAQALAADSAAKYEASIASGSKGTVISQPVQSTKDHGIELPRVHADIAINDLFNLRIGKWITPAGIWNVDHGSPIILTISQPNQTAFLPIFPISQTGIQAFGRTSVGDHDFSYASWISTGRGSNFLGSSDYAQDPEHLDDWAVGTHVQADLSLGDIAWRLGATGHTGTQRGQDVWTNIPVVGYDLTKAGTPAAVSTGGLETMNTTVEDSYYQRDYIYGLDTKLKLKGLTLQGEWNHRTVLNISTPDDLATDFNAWYTLAAYEIPLGAQFNVTPYFMHERIDWSNVQHNPALGLTTFPMNGWTINSLGLNFGLWSTVHVKFEWSHNNIDAVQVSDPSSMFYNHLSSSDLTVDRYASQLSVAF